MTSPSALSVRGRVSENHNHLNQSTFVEDKRQKVINEKIIMIIRTALIRSVNVHNSVCSSFLFKAVCKLLVLSTVCKVNRSYHNNTDKTLPPLPFAPPFSTISPTLSPGCACVCVCLCLCVYLFTTRGSLVTAFTV